MCIDRTLKRKYKVYEDKCLWALFYLSVRMRGSLYFYYFISIYNKCQSSRYNFWNSDHKINLDFNSGHKINLDFNSEPNSKRIIVHI